MEKTREKEQTMACRDDRRGIAPEIPLLKGQHPFHLKIDQRNCLQSTQRSNPISAELRVNPQNTVFHQTFIVKCHLSFVKPKVVLLSDRRMTSWNYPAKLQSARIEHCFIAMLLFLVLPIHISFKVFTKNAISIWTIFWKMPHFTPAEIFRQE